MPCQGWSTSISSIPWAGAVLAHQVDELAPRLRTSHPCGPGAVDTMWSMTAKGELGVVNRASRLFQVRQRAGAQGRPLG